MAKATEVAADMAERTRSENFRWLRDRNRMVENINLAIEGVILSYFFYPLSSIIFISIRILF